MALSVWWVAGSSRDSRTDGKKYVLKVLTPAGHAYWAEFLKVRYYAQFYFLYSLMTNTTESSSVLKFADDTKLYKVVHCHQNGLCYRMIWTVSVNGKNGIWHSTLKSIKWYTTTKEVSTLIQHTLEIIRWKYHLKKTWEWCSRSRHRQQCELKSEQSKRAGYWDLYTGRFSLNIQQSSGL